MDNRSIPKHGSHPYNCAPALLVLHLADRPLTSASQNRVRAEHAVLGALGIGRISSRAKPCVFSSRRVQLPDFSATAISPLTPSASSTCVIVMCEGRNPAFSRRLTKSRASHAIGR